MKHTFVDLGEMPLANSYLREGELDREEPRYPLHARLCDACLLVQVDSVVSADTLFREYSYFSSYSDSWVEQARRFAESATKQLGLGPESLVVEVASNDGYLLRHFRSLGIPVLGIEPAGNVAAAATDLGIRTEVKFFGSEVAEDLAERGMRPDLIVANNVLAHVPDLNDFVHGLATLLTLDGVLSIEFPHLLRLISGTQFDTIYHEHFSYFSLASAERVLAAHGLTVFDIEELQTHGGSLRLWVSHVDSAPVVGNRVQAVRDVEASHGLLRVDGYAGFADDVDACRRSLLDFLAEASADGNQVAAYGAAAKGNTLLNYCGITVADIAYVADRSRYKQGRFLPGSRLPIRCPDSIRDTRPDFLLILPWNLRTEITDQLRDIRAWGGRFLTAVPRVDILP